MRTLTMVALLVGLAGCGKQPEVPKPGEPQGRAETQNIRNVDVLGAQGAAVANKVDAVLDANDQRKDNLDAAIDAQSNPR